MRSVISKTIQACVLVHMLVMTTAGCSNEKGQAKQDNRDVKGWLGVYVQDLDEELRGYFEVDKETGVMVNQVIADSPAQTAGILEEDLIVRFDRKRITNTQDLITAVQKLSPGEQVKIEIIRDNEKKIMAIDIGERPEQEERRAKHENTKSPQPPAKYFQSNGPWLGIEMTSMNADLAEYFEVGENEGVLVLAVVEDSPAEQAGIKAGDILLKIAGQKIRSQHDVFETVADSQAGDEVEIAFKRKGKTNRIQVELGQRTNRQYHRSNPENWHEFRQDLQNWQDFEREIRKAIPELRHELRRLRDIEIPVDEIEKQIHAEMSAASEKIKAELKRMQRELQRLESDSVF